MNESERREPSARTEGRPTRRLRHTRGRTVTGVAPRKNRQQAPSSLSRGSVLDGLGRVAIEPRLNQPASRGLVAEPGQGDEGRVEKRLLATETLCDLVAAHAREAQVDEENLGTEQQREVDGRGAVVGDPNVVPQALEPPARHVGDVDLVSTKSSRRASTGATVEMRAASWVREAGGTMDSRNGRRTVNSLPRPGPALSAMILAAVELDEPPGEGQADPQAAVATLAGAGLRVKGSRFA